MSEPPLWTYDAHTNTLAGPVPIPDIPPMTAISVEQLCASTAHDVVEVDQELGLARLGTGYVPLDCTEHDFRIPGWHRTGWYARYRRNTAAGPFILTHVWADEWGATRFTPWC